MKNLIQKLGYIAGLVFSEKIIKYYSALMKHLYTGYCRSRLKSIGENSTIDYPITIIGAKYISIGNSVSVGRGGCLTAWSNESSKSKVPEIIIGNNVVIGEDFHITASNKILIGDAVLFGKKVTITDNSHGRCDGAKELYINPLEREIYSKGPVIIKDKVWIGDKVSVLPGLTIGEGAIVGANSVVSRDVPDYCIVAGVPTKVIRNYN